MELKISALLLIKLLENGALGLLVQWTSLAMQINGSPLMFSAYPYEISKMRATNPKAYQEKGLSYVPSEFCPIFSSGLSNQKSTSSPLVSIE